MTLTEKEAEKKICPFLGMEQDSLPDPYTEEYGFSPVLCRASRCMAWQWDIEPSYGNSGKGHCAMTRSPK